MGRHATPLVCGTRIIGGDVSDITTHTPEPWATMHAEGYAYISISDDNLGLIAAVPIRGSAYPHRENATRIVACVNVFAGVADPVAEMARLRAIEQRAQAQSAECLPAAIDEALALMERNSPCAHESYEEAGFNWRKCCDCGRTIENARAERAVAYAQTYEKGVGVLRAELTRLYGVEQMNRDLVETFAAVVARCFPGALDALKLRG